MFCIAVVCDSLLLNFIVSIVRWRVILQIVIKLYSKILWVILQSIFWFYQVIRWRPSLWSLVYIYLLRVHILVYCVSRLARSPYFPPHWSVPVWPAQLNIPVLLYSFVMVNNDWVELVYLYWSIFRLSGYTNNCN